MQCAVNVDYVTHFQFSTLKGWLHYRVLIRQHWQEGTFLPLSQAQICQDRWDTLMLVRCRLKNAELGTVLSVFKKTDFRVNRKVNHTWLTDLWNWFKNLKELHGDWVDIGDIASRATPREMSCHCPVTPDCEKNARAAVAYLVRGGAQWLTILFSN